MGRDTAGLAPASTAVGFVNVGFEELALSMTSWRKDLERKSRSTRVQVESLDDVVALLGPFVEGDHTRYAVVATEISEWTAILDNGLLRPDPEPVVAYMSRRLGCRGVVAGWRPDLSEPRVLWGYTEFILLGAEQREFLNYVRSVQVLNDGGTWRFNSSGEPQPFEDLSAYQRRRVKDRFTIDELEDYCAALGLHPFDSSFYGSEAQLIDVGRKPTRDKKQMSLGDARRYLGLDTP